MLTLIRLFLNWSRQLAKMLLVPASWVAYGFSFVRGTRVIRYIHDGRLPLSGARRVAIFVHYDRYGRVHDFVYYYLRQLTDLGFAVIFVSNGSFVTPTDIERLCDFSALIVLRMNRGYDFGAYKDGIAQIPDIAALDQLLLVNDSVYGPFHSLGPMLEKMTVSRAEVWGATDCWLHSFHLQSYFLLFHSAALQSAAFQNYWKQVRLVQSKTWVVRKYEIGLTRALQNGGLRCRAAYGYRDIMQAVVLGLATSEAMDSGGNPAMKAFRLQLIKAINNGIPMNGGHVFWDYLIGNMGFPFLKRELLHKNPTKNPALIHWERLLRESTDYDPDLIIRHLEVSLKHRSI